VTVSPAPYHRRRLSLLGRAGLVILGITCLGAALLATIGLQDDLAPADLALVLGAKVELDGQPSRGLRARLERTAELYRAHAFPWILVSGGIGKEGYDEAAVMAATLAAAGVPRERIILDNQGVTTYASVRNTRRLLRERNWQRVMVITQYYHLPRARLTLSRFGMAPVSFAHAHCFEWRDLYSLPREEVGLLAYALRSYPQD
jgi:vancomycin permeability regulator SanA